MPEPTDGGSELRPLPYHLAIADRLEALEPRSWQAIREAANQRAPRTPDAGSTSPDGTGVLDPEAREAVAAEAVPAAVPPLETAPPMDDQPEDLAFGDMDQQLLRHAYRMEVESHPRVHAAARRAAEALGVSVPIVIYQLEGPDSANAGLIFRPDEAVIACSGNLLQLLGDDELAACFGHELAHHALWSAMGRRVLVADRLLNAMSFDAATPAVYLETARRFALATELYADRGGLAAAGGNLDAAIASLVKTATGLSEVDPQAFLRQAEASHPERGSHGTSHPETVLRAWALARWHAGEGDVATAALLAPNLDIERLDLLDRATLEALTRSIVLDVMAVDALRTEDVVAHARQFLVDGTSETRLVATSGSRRASGVPGPAVTTRVPDGASAETRKFLAYVLLDLATVDADLEDAPLPEAIAVARDAGILPAFEQVAKRELGLGQRAWDGLVKRSVDRRLALA